MSLADELDAALAANTTDDPVVVADARALLARLARGDVDD